MKKTRKEKIIVERFGHYKLTIRYLANSNKAQATMEDLSALRFPLIWSHLLTDEQANSVLDIFMAIGYFDIPITA